VKLNKSGTGFQFHFSGTNRNNSITELFFADCIGFAQLVQGVEV
jgi:hypothetical protein